MANRIEDSLTQSEVKFSFNGVGEMAHADGTVEFQLEAGARAKDIQLFLEPAFQRTCLEIAPSLRLRKQIADFCNGLFGGFLDVLKLFFQSRWIVQEFAPAHLCAQSHRG